ncbi:hypothetical protein [Actinoplanes sp. NPDC023714]|uniref:hypothetical protein n=1 Tax=Actinoplanes sp. NPDC023714 TaxID=3154322 RepID=UPI0033EF4A97
MESALDVSYQVVENVFGAGSGVPWWAWVAPMVLIFWKMLMPMVAPETAGAGTGSAKKDKKDKKSKKK